MAKKKVRSKSKPKSRPSSRPKPRTRPKRRLAARKPVKKQAVKKSKQLRKKSEPMAKLLLPLGRIKEIFRTRYGFFLYDGSEFVINTPETPSPWCNILTNGNYGAVISQTGAGLSFKGGIANKITRWHQDTNTDRYGKFIYIRDNQTQQFWSAAWKPVCKQPEFYEVRHGIGYTNITSKNQGILSSLIYYVAADEPVEIWQMRIKNDTDQERFLSVFSYLEWDFFRPTGNREYDKLFTETSFNEALSAVFAKSHRSEHAFHSVNQKVSTFTCGRDFFLGLYRDNSNPRCVEKGMCFGEQGRYNDPAACLHMEIELPPRGEKELLFTVGMTADIKEAESIIKKYKNVKTVEEEFSRTGQRWGIRLSNFHMTTPDEGANILNNKWLRYQAVSSGLAAVGSYYNPVAMVDFKNSVINSLILLSINPKYCADQIISAAERQFENGLVIEQWQPGSHKGKKNGLLEYPLWLVYAVCEYIKETKELSLLDEQVKFQDGPKADMLTHCTKALDLALNLITKHGLLPVQADENASLPAHQAAGANPESVWLSQFLLYVLSEFIEICRFKQHKSVVANYEARLKKIKDKMLKASWDKDRFLKAITHSGRQVGISKGKGSRIFLDTQVWGIISGLCDPKNSAVVMDSVKASLYSSVGPKSVSPAFAEYDDDMPLISELPQGVLENGGVSVEQSCWAIWAETLLGRPDNAWSIYSKLDPVDRSNRSDTYKLEPYVSCEYIDSTDAKTAGRARYSWYNRSAYWMFKVMTECILGIRPTMEGLRIDPCIPSRWRLFRVRRNFRNAYYTIEVSNPRFVSKGISEIIVDGKSVKSNIIPDFADEKKHHVKVILGKQK